MTSAMTDLTRRRIMRIAALPATPSLAQSSPIARVVLVGGGFAGANCARYLARAAPEASITLIDPARPYVSCPLSDAGIGGIVGMDATSIDRGSGDGATSVVQRVTRIDPVAKPVMTEAGQTFDADILVILPGIDFVTGGVEGYIPSRDEAMPHAWKAGRQTALLRQRLVAMSDGGPMPISIPAASYRRPPGPFERAGLIADYLRRAKPRSKVVILNASGAFPKEAPFREGWEGLYPGMIEHVDIAAAPVIRADPRAMTLHTEFDDFPGDVVNLISPHWAGQIGACAALTDDGGSCPVQAPDVRSASYPDVYVLGDAARSPLPKSASAGTTAARVCALGIAARLTGQDFGPPA